MIAYLDLPSGFSGDMCLSCLVDAGWDIAELQKVIDSLNLGEPCSVSASRVMRQAIQATHVDVQVPHSHKHRHLHHIEAIINGSSLSQRTKDRAIAVFRRLALAPATRVAGAVIALLGVYLAL